MERRQLLSTYLVSNTNDDSNPHSLRWALEQVNSEPGGSTIEFRIPGSGAVWIRLNAPLPVITKPVAIDGTTQTGYESAPLVVVDGSGLASGSSGLIISAGGSSVRGLAIVGF